MTSPEPLPAILTLIEKEMERHTPSLPVADERICYGCSHSRSHAHAVSWPCPTRRILDGFKVAVEVLRMIPEENDHEPEWEEWTKPDGNDGPNRCTVCRAEAALRSIHASLGGDEK